MPFSIVKKTKKPVYDVRHGIKHKDRIKYLSINGSPLFDDNGDFKGMVATIDDISEKIKTKRKLFESEEKYKLLFSNINEAFSLKKIVLNDNGEAVNCIIHEVNKAYEELMGFDKKDLIGKQMTEVLPEIEEFFDKWLQRFYKVAVEKKVLSFEDYCHPLGKWLSVNTFCPKESFFAVTFIDITKRKESEKELGIYRENLEILVSERTSDLLKAKEDLEATNKKLLKLIEREKELSKIKDDFITNVNHEIKTPLTSIIMNSQYLAKRIETLPKEKVLHKIDNLQKSSKALLKIVNEILDFSKIECGEFSYNRSTILIEQLFSEIKFIFSPLFKDKGIEFKVLDSDKLEIENDFDHLIKILSQLLSNTLKFTDRGFVELSCSQKGSNLEFIVKDTGCGIDLESQSIIFQKFTQGWHENNKASGTGVGLYIVQKLLELHGGRISVQSAINEGSEFKVTLPQKSSLLI